ncbi:hypothetical protein CEUSTIGMA_g3727.t1 [Chlamydomonas eustigma]|uniref:Uncharacterized protein n=1 Tax=Chlamydomonas eustigma TaxID=1157962 RepID=A0A250X066_9CHLO|nr:hypothetical protein CEUSTIGMA_g3727.t1 [Chlamydomonas eustigma]|eukprot:GAX76282.1 hypothetical protein CEUSTIGMA_g3727.t1 [Chlamydomonas eustigma]
MYNIVNDAIRSPEYDSGIGCPEDMSENLRAARENGSTVVLVQYLGLTAMAMIGGFAMHPLLIKLTAVTWGLEPSVS